MEDWEIELMQTPNTISSYMMGEYQRMKYRRKYRSSNKVVEPEYITGALNYSMIGSIVSDGRMWEVLTARYFSAIC
ncbi:hypothetical protein, partial [Anaerostipes caccae]|uniref:hypothetical protein n=1 Tax=Anaerostipes caccae TaxID=105841 RepID=UPI0022E2A776